MLAVIKDIFLRASYQQLHFRRRSGSVLLRFGALLRVHRHTLRTFFLLISRASLRMRLSVFFSLVLSVVDAHTWFPEGASHDRGA
jgi:hypothetical protein